MTMRQWLSRRQRKVYSASSGFSYPAPGQGAWKLWLLRAVFESFLIIFSVLLALVLNEWNEDRKAQEAADAALRAVVAEIRSNRGRMEYAMNFHRDVTDTLNASTARNELPTLEVVNRGMFRPATVVESAWNSAQETSAPERWPYELALSIGRVYERQSAYDNIARELVVDVYMDLRRRGVEVVLQQGYTGIAVLTQDFSTREREMLVQYDALLEAIEASQQ